jgi:hypothetical protein
MRALWILLVSLMLALPSSAQVPLLPPMGADSVLLTPPQKPPVMVQRVVLAPFPASMKMKPPAVYKQWWRDVQRCSGLYSTDSVFTTLDFYVINSPAFTISGDPGDGTYAGWTNPWVGEIYVVFGAMLNKRVVQHEMIHELLYQNGKNSGHSSASTKYYDLCMLDRA